jgi:DNA modification methylase
MNKNNLNDLSGKEWVFSTNSILNFPSSEQDFELYRFINEIYVTRFSTKGKESFAHQIRKVHPSPKPPQLMADLINFFSKKGQIIFDPFCGVGGTLLGCSLTERKGVGIDLNPLYKDIYEEASSFLNLPLQEFYTGDSSELLSKGKIPHGNYDLILTDPPYGNMMSKVKTGDSAKKKGSVNATPFSDSLLDIGNVDRDIFLLKLKNIIELSVERLNNKKYVLIFIKDLQPKEDYHGMLHFDIVNVISSIVGLKYKGLKIWYDKSINLYPYGYPYAYVSNQLHQYILIFRKEEIKK